MNTKQLILLSITIYFSLNLSACSDKTDVQKLEFNSRVLSIPSRYMDKQSLVQKAKSIVGVSDARKSVIVRIPSAEVAANIAGFEVTKSKSFKDDLELLLTELTDMELIYQLKPEYFRDLDNLWNSQGAYRNKVIEFDKRSGWVKVYRKLEYPDSFAIIKGNLDGPIPDSVKEFWLAHCLVIGPKSKKTVRCSSFILIDNLLIEFSLSLANLKNLDAVSIYIEKHVELWSIKETTKGSIQ